MFRQDYANLAIFNGLPASLVNAISPFLEEVVFSEGKTIFEQGDAANCIFILLEGEVTIRYKPYDGPPLTVARIQAGEVFGWSAALGRQVYTSNAEAACAGVAYRIHANSLKHLCDSNPVAGGVLLERLADSIAERLRNTNSTVLELLSQGIDRRSSGSKRSAKNER
jgi:CRP/FNR family cyclic AMP-dependent transcriptional regulator